jgi:hypothetical protein
MAGKLEVIATRVLAKVERSLRKLLNWQVEFGAAQRLRLRAYGRRVPACGSAITSRIRAFELAAYSCGTPGIGRCTLRHLVIGNPVARRDRLQLQNRTKYFEMPQDLNVPDLQFWHQDSGRCHNSLRRKRPPGHLSRPVRLCAATLSLGRCYGRRGLAAEPGPWKV